MGALGVAGGLVAVGDLLGEVLGQIPDAAGRVLGPGQHALGVEPLPEPGHMQRLVLVPDGVKGLVPRRQDFAGGRVEVGGGCSSHTGSASSSKRTTEVSGHHTW